MSALREAELNDPDEKIRDLVKACWTLYEVKKASAFYFQSKGSHTSLQALHICMGWMRIFFLGVSRRIMISGDRFPRTLAVLIMPEPTVRHLPFLPSGHHQWKILGCHTTLSIEHLLKKHLLLFHFYPSTR